VLDPGEAAWSGDAARAGVLRPRAGLPALANAGGAFQVLCREPRSTFPPRLALVAADGARPAALAIEDEVLEPEEGGLTLARRTVRVTRGAPGAYDLRVEWPCGIRALAPRAVWLHGEDPALTSPLRVAHITDLHLGRSADSPARLEQVIAGVNALSPDLVLLTGDVVDNGDRAEQFGLAHRLLSALRAPALVVAGNHDHGFHPRALSGRGFGPGWRHFGDAFHAYTQFAVSRGGWDFIGFDSGPTLVSPLVRTRGLGPAAVAALERALERSHAAGRRGAVLFSHTRSGGGAVGRMGHGAEDLQDVLRRAARRGQRVLHLSGHTHWSDVFELDPECRGFIRWDPGRYALDEQAIHAPVALVTTQSATHSWPFKLSGRGYGWSCLSLGQDATRIRFHQYGLP